jgi:hypothetical protein
MRPKQHKMTGCGDLFQARLDQIINLNSTAVESISTAKRCASILIGACQMRMRSVPAGDCQAIHDHFVPKE